MEMALLILIHLDQFKGFSYSLSRCFKNSRSRKPPYFLHIACFLSFHEAMAQTSQGEMTRGDKYANFETGPPGAWVRMT